MYLMNSIRPAITYVVGRLNRYIQNPNKDHWIKVAKLARYLEGTIDYGLKYGISPPILKEYSDVNWIFESNELKSTSGYIFTFGGVAMSWISSKQTCIAHFTMESKLIALEKTCSEAKWLRNLLVDVPIIAHPLTVVPIHCNCQATIMRVKSKIYNGKNRRICIRDSIVK